jgi:hypothetical protein
MNSLAGVRARSLENKDLAVKSLFLTDLASFSLRISALGPLPPLPPGVGPPFHPEQKVKLDKSEATGAVLFFRHDFLGYDGDGRTSFLLTGHVTFSRRWERESVMEDMRCL